MVTIRVSSRGQLVIPAHTRERYGIKEGQRLVIEEKRDYIILRPITKNFISKLEGVLPPKGGLLKDFVKQKHKDKALKSRKK